MNGIAINIARIKIRPGGRAPGTAVAASAIGGTTAAAQKNSPASRIRDCGKENHQQPERDNAHLKES